MGARLAESPAGPAPPRGKGRRLGETATDSPPKNRRECSGGVLPSNASKPSDPKRLKRELKGRGAEVLKRDFPLAAEELMRRLGLHPGAELRLAFTKIGNDFWVIRLK